MDKSKWIDRFLICWSNIFFLRREKKWFEHTQKKTYMCKVNHLSDQEQSVVKKKKQGKRKQFSFLWIYKHNIDHHHSSFLVCHHYLAMVILLYFFCVVYHSNRGLFLPYTLRLIYLFNNVYTRCRRKRWTSERKKR